MKKAHIAVSFFGDPARIQTWNLLSRNQVLYSVELRGLKLGVQKYIFFSFEQKHFNTLIH